MAKKKQQPFTMPYRCVKALNGMTFILDADGRDVVRLTGEHALSHGQLLVHAYNIQAKAEAFERARQVSESAAD